MTIPLKVFGRTAVSEFLGDRIVFRNLVPVDPRLPALASFVDQIGLPPGQIPRKSEPGYALAIAHLLRQAHQLAAPGTTLQRLIFLGDTHLLDATAFDNLCRISGWPGIAFIGSESATPPRVDLQPTASGQQLYLANRWSLLADFDQSLGAQGFPVDEHTVVVVDLDKTAIGARGRNGHTIDQARLQAVQNTVSSLLGPSFDQGSFDTAYQLLNQPEFHTFTADNQDYLAYICLVLGSGVYSLEHLVPAVRAGQMSSFFQFIEGVDEVSSSLPAGLSDIHQEILTNVRLGDPTPFKAFRRNEYQTTVARMGWLADSSSVEQMIADEIVITQEVRQAALDWHSRGALLFGLSDKPDEASLPPPELAAQGSRPLHRTPTHAVGNSIAILCLLVFIPWLLTACGQPGSFRLPLDETMAARLGQQAESQPVNLARPAETAQASEEPTAAPTPIPTPQPTPTSSLNPAGLRGVVIRFWHPWADQAGALMQKLAQEYNASNEWGIEVSAASPGSLEDLDAAVYQAIAPQAIEQDTSPDLVAGYLYHALGWHAAQPLADLSSYINDPVLGLPPDELADYYPAYLEPGQLAGQRLALPAQALGEVLLYNQTWAQELGFSEPPATPQELMKQACQAAQANNQDDDPENDRTGGLILSTHYSAMLGWIEGFGGRVYDPDGRDSTKGPYMFAQDSVTDAFTLLRDLYDQGCAFLPEDGYPEDEFANRRGLLAVDHVTSLPYQAELIEKSVSQDQWTVIPFPSPAGQPAMDAYGPSYTIFSSSPERELAAWLFMRWLMQPENQARLVQATGSLPLRAETASLLEEYGATRPQWSAAVQLLPDAVPEPWDSSWNTVRWAVSDAATQLFRSYFTLEQTPELSKFLDKTAAELHAWTAAGGK